MDADSSPHAVVAAVADMVTARRVVEDLEEHGVPPGSIALLGAMEEREGDADPAESEAFSNLTRSIGAGGAAGATAGGVLGTLVTLALPGVGPVIAGGLGAIYGAGIGGAAGGMSVAKYNSAAWTETHEMVQRGQIAVGVHHEDESVVAEAEEIMRRQDLSSVDRFDRGE